MAKKAPKSSTFHFAAMYVFLFCVASISFLPRFMFWIFLAAVIVLEYCALTATRKAVAVTQRADGLENQTHMGASKMRHYCSVYLRDDAIYVISQVKTKLEGFYVLSEPVEKLEPTASAYDIGRAVLSALDASERVYENQQAVPDVLKVLKFKSFGRFDKGAKLCSIDEVDGEVSIHPNEPIGGGFCGIPDQSATVFRADVEAVGRTVINRASVCVARQPKRAATHSKHNTNVEKEVPVCFGYKMAWLAIETTETESVVNALGLKNDSLCSWKKGIEQAYKMNSRIFVTPSVAGWTFVVGGVPSLPEAGDHNRNSPKFIFLESLSSKLGHVQYFGTHRVSEYHAWAKAQSGKVLRAYGYADGKILVNVGALTSEEMELGFAFSKRVEESGEYPDEDSVMQIAEKWSINPQTLDAYEDDDLGDGPGILGDIST